MHEFSRIKRLPPYVFNITAELKMAARRRGEDIIDLSIGNPDGPTPQHIVDKLVEAAQRQDTHGYSVSKGIPRLRKAICGVAAMAATAATLGLTVLAPVAAAPAEPMVQALVDTRRLVLGQGPGEVAIVPSRIDVVAIRQRS